MFSRSSKLLKSPSITTKHSCVHPTTSVLDYQISSFTTATKPVGAAATENADLAEDIEYTTETHDQRKHRILHSRKTSKLANQFDIAATDREMAFQQHLVDHPDA